MATTFRGEGDNTYGSPESITWGVFLGFAVEGHGGVGKEYRNYRK